MAKVQLSVEELLQLARGEMPVDEIKKDLAQGMLETWNAPDTQVLIKAEAERLAQITLERIIRDAYKEQTSSWGRPSNTYTGWAIPVLREVLRTEFSIAHVLEALKPEIDELVQESMGKFMASFFTNQAKEDKQ
jgi:hypothetical protein